MTRVRKLIGLVLARVLVIGAGAALPLLPVFGEGGPDTRDQLPQLQGLEDANTFVPVDNPLTAQKIELGRVLFFDTRLSRNNTIACASCHLADKGFTDGMPVSAGINGLKGGRSAPVSFNRVYSKVQFWTAVQTRWKISPSRRSTTQSNTALPIMMKWWPRCAQFLATGHSFMTSLVERS